MAHRLLTVFAFCLALFAGAGVHANAAPSAGPTTAYCTPPNTLADGQNYDAAVFNANWTYGSTCPGQYGDLFTDGPLVGSAVFTYFSTSLNFTIPSVTWVAQGQRIVTTAVPETAPANTTTYWWLSTATDSFTSTLTSSPPDNFSVLEYTIVTSGTGITSVTNPTSASEVIAGNLSLSALPSGSCLQTGTGGVITATGLACGSGSGAIAGVNGSGNVTASTVSGTATVGEINNPTWTGAPSINGTSTTGQLNFGSDATASLQRTGTNAFQFISGSNPTVTAGGGFLAGSSTYGPTSASVNGGLSATSVTASGLSCGNWLHETTGGLLSTTSGPCLTGTGIIAVNATGNLTASTVSGTTTIGIVNAPTFSGAVTASQINASGAGLTPGTVPNNALVTTPVTSVGASAPLGTSGGTTPTISVNTNPAFSGTPTASGFTATGPVIAGSATAFVPSLGDLSASEGVSKGQLVLGGTTSDCKLDYGITTASTDTIDCNTTVLGTLTGTTLVGTGLTPGDCVQVTTGGALTNTGSACGSATSVTAVNGGGPVTASTVSGTVTLGCPTCVVGLTAGSNVTIGSGTSPSVALVNSPAVSGSLGVDGNAAPAHGIAAGTGSTAATFTSGVSGSASNSFVLTAANCGTVNLVEFVNSSTAEDQFGCNGTLQIGASTYGPTSTSVAGAMGVDSNTAGSSGITGGVAGTTPFNLTAASNTSASEGFVFNTNTACHASTDTFFNAKVNGTTQFYSDCSGDVYSDSLNQINTSFTPGQCFICIGTTGVATTTTNGIKLGNAAVATTGVTTISTANNGTVAGIATTALEVTNTGNRVLAIDNGGDTGIAGNVNVNGWVEAGEATAPTISAGDVAASRSTTTGEVNIGGSISSCPIDFNLTISGELNSNCGFNANGQLSATSNIISSGVGAIISTLTGPVIAGGNTAPTLLTNGYVYSSNTASSGGLVAGGTTHRGVLTFGSAAAATWDMSSDSGATNFENQGTILADASALGANAPTLSSGDIGASETASCGAQYLGGSTSSDKIDFGCTTSGVETHSQPVSLPNLKDTGLGSATVSPLCGASGTNVSQCTAAHNSMSITATSQASVASGTTANTYQQATTATITTGVSQGTVGNWFVVVIADIGLPTPAGANAAFNYGCIESSSTFTTKTQTEYNPAGPTVCNGSPTGAIAGAPGFGEWPNAYGAALAYLSEAKSHIMWSGTVANSTGFTATVNVANTGTTSITNYVTETILAWPQ
jgi:hypothetical protein